MNSPHQREQLPDLLSDALDATERARVESHIAQCEQCARELRALQAMQHSLLALPAQAPPDRIRANVRAALRENPKQVWTLSSFLANRERVGQGRALPFALPTRQLAWGGAVAVAAVGLMLLARPSLQNGSYSTSAPVSETELAARADQNAEVADTAPDATGGSAIEPAPKSAKPKQNQKAKPNAKSPQNPAIAPPRAVQPEGLPPIPAVEVPSIEIPVIKRAPQNPPKPTQTPRANKKTARPVAPPKPAPKIPVKSESEAQPIGQPEKERDNAAPATATKPAPALLAPKPPITLSDSENSDRTESSDAATAPGANASANNGARSDEQKNRSSDNAPTPSANNAFEAAPMMRHSLAKASLIWMGGEVTATVERVQSFAGRARMAPEPNAPILTLSVSKAIGDARIFLYLPDGEVQIWTGLMNELPVKIRLDNAALSKANLRSGQKIRARLEQIDGEGNPKGSILFDLLWP